VEGAEERSYMPGFGNEFSTEALPGALPDKGNNPQRCPYDLYAEQLSGTAFTMPRHSNQRSWLYRTRPSVVHVAFTPADAADAAGVQGTFGPASAVTNPNQLRWLPLPMPEEGAGAVDWVQGLVSIGGSGDPAQMHGLAVHMYTANASMGDKAFQDSDGDLLIVAQEGALRITTELGKMDVAPREICVIQRGVRFSVDVDGPSRGYVLEIFKGHFVLPDLGPIGANGLANPRDFLTPEAWYEDREDPFVIVNKFGGELFQAAMPFSPFNVVAWHGNYAPYKYDLDKFCCMNSVTFDHPDPSIYTVLTCQTDTPGLALADFVIFPTRWMVQEDTFRPPWYHRNVMSEFMGMVWGAYDAKEAKGKSAFLPGGASLHSCCTPHGPDAVTFEKASTMELAPVKFDKGLAFMFETCHMLRLTEYASKAPHLDHDYHKCWTALPKKFDPSKR
jgi:homogentisate 1,2-dioxygenase